MIWSSVGIWLIGPIETNFCGIWIRYITFHPQNFYLKFPLQFDHLFCLSRNVLKVTDLGRERGAMCLTTWEQILVGCHRIISVRLGLLFWEKLGWCVDKMAARCFCEKMIFRHKRGLVFAVSHVKFYHRNHVDYDIKMWKVIISPLGIVVFNPDTFVLLTHRTLMPHICVRELGQHWFRWWLVACLAPSHYLNRHWLIVNPIHRN